jgi:site-specific recombinase XerD
VEEVARLIDSARNLFERTMLMVLYSTGMRNAEMRHLQVKDIEQPVDAHPYSARQGWA